MGGRHRGVVPIVIEDPRLRRPSLEERIAGNHREIQVLLSDNQRLATTHLALKQELSIADQDVEHLTATARKLREERDLEVKDAFDRSLKVEADLRVNGIDALKAELSQVKADVQGLTESNLELSLKLKAINSELDKAKLDASHVPAIKDDLHTMRQELLKGRAAIELEKKTRAANLEQNRGMETSMVSMQDEIERLLAELANAEKRARAAAAAAAAPNPSSAYMGSYANPIISYVGSPYPQYTMHQAQGIAEGAPPVPYGPPVGGHGPLDMQQTHVPKG